MANGAAHELAKVMMKEIEKIIRIEEIVYTISNVIILEQFTLIV